MMEMGGDVHIVGDKHFDKISNTSHFTSNRHILQSEQGGKGVEEGNEEIVTEK